MDAVLSHAHTVLDRVLALVLRIQTTAIAQERLASSEGRGTGSSFTLELPLGGV